MGILFILTQIALLVSFILVKKTEKELNILSFIVMGVGLLLCYNVLICYVFTFFGIPVTLLSLSIINILLTVIFISFIVKKKQIQKYKLFKMDLLYIAILGVIVLGTAYVNFGFPFNIKYETGDPSVHCLTSEMFARADSLLVNVKDYVYGSFSTRKAASYVNSGLIMKCFEGVMDSFDLYKIFIAFGIFIFAITSWAMYLLLSSFAKNKLERFLAFIVSMLYSLGYPLNSFLFGFEYLSMGILMCELIFMMILYFKDEEMKLSYKIGMLALLNFGLFNSYWMFVPFMYPAEWIYFCVESYEEKKTLFTKKNILILTITLLVPFILGFIYYMVPQVYSIFIKEDSIDENFLDMSQYLVGRGLAVKGYIYANIYSNMLLLLPIPIYLMCKKLKENSFSFITLVVCIAFIEILLMGYAYGKVSLYYLSKNYYILWFILMYLNYKGIILLCQKSKVIPLTSIVAYIAIVIITLGFGNVKMRNQKKYYLEDEKVYDFANIYGANRDILKNHETDLYYDEIQILKYMNENLSKDSRIEVIGDSEQCFWQYALTEYINNKDSENDLYGEHKIKKKLFDTTQDIYKADYIVCFKRSFPYNTLKGDIAQIDGETIIENDYAKIIKCNK